MFVSSKAYRNDCRRLKRHGSLQTKVCYLNFASIPLVKQQHIYVLFTHDCNYLLGFSFLPRTSSLSDTPLTLNTCHRTPGMSPMAPPIEPPIPSNMTSSCSSTKFKAPSRGRNAVIDLPFFINCTLTHFLTAELGCLDSIPTFSKTIPLACGEPSSGFAFLSNISILRLKYLFAHLALFLFDLKTRPANRPNGDLAIYIFT